MKKLSDRYSQGTKRLLAFGAMMVLTLSILMPARAFAGQLTTRKLTLGSSAGAASTTWTFEFTPTATTALNGITFQVCDAPSGTCNIPGSWTNSGSAFGSLTYNASAQTGWALDNTAGFLRIKNNSSVASVASPVVATINTVTNPNTTNASFYVRIATYTGDDYTGALDTGVVAAATSQQITVTGTVSESLTFCTGASGITNSSCSGATGSSLDLSNLSASSTASGLTQIGVGTNATTGYSISVTGTTLTSGGNTVTALAAQAASSIGSEQFGLNLRDNATPNVGADPDGSGSATPTASYNTVDQYRFVSGDAIASKASADGFRRFQVSYIANISPNTEAGAYSAVLTYICVPSF